MAGGRRRWASGIALRVLGPNEFFARGASRSGAPRAVWRPTSAPDRPVIIGPMLRAIIFDFDGVIADTEPLHYRAFCKVLAGLSITVTPDEYFAKYVGLSDREFIQRLFKELGLPLPDPIRVRWQRAKDAAYRARIESGMAIWPGVAEFVPMVARRWPLAICSGARRVEI